MEIWGIDLAAAWRHECLHWCLSLVLCSAVLFLNWAILRRCGLGLSTAITSTDIFWWLGFWVSLGVVSHYIGDELIRIPFI